MLDVAIRAAQEAGSFIQEAYGKRSRQADTFKEENDILQVVTQDDVEAEKIILSILKQAAPDYAIFSEEAGDNDNTSDYRWIVDPIDGTSNYARGIPFFCVSIALTYKGEPILGVVYQPITDELFVAEKGKGATLNGVKIGVSDLAELDKAFVTIDRGKSKREKDRLVAVLDVLTPHVRSMRMPGSSALQTCYVACGKFDAAVFCGLSFYDIAASAVIAREAGAVMSDFSGRAWKLKTGDSLLCNSALQKNMSNLLKDV